jgi:hypothetical protein
MWFTKFFSAMLVTLMGLLPSSCTKSKTPSAQPSQHPTGTTTIVTSAQSSTNRNLGNLELTNHYETCVNLGAGKSCTIKPILLDRHDLQLTMSLESKGTNGRTKGLSVVQFVTKTGASFEVAVGGMNLTLTPILSNE